MASQQQPCHRICRVNCPFHKEGFQLHVPYQCHEMFCNFNMLPETDQYDDPVLHALHAKTMHIRRNHAITPYRIFCKTALYPCFELFIVSHIDAYVGFLLHTITTEDAMKPASAWWRHRMETFSASLVICARISPVSGEFPAQGPATRSLDVSFDLRLNKHMIKQWGSWRIETSSHPLWRQGSGLQKENYRSLGRLMVAELLC